MKPTQPKRRGRPPNPPEKGTRVPLGLRVSADLKARLDALAAENNRTQSQEAERLILLGLEFERRQSAAPIALDEAAEDRIVSRIVAELAKTQGRGAK